MSDLHLEHLNTNQAEDFFQELTGNVIGDAPEFLVLAGDITSFSKHNLQRVNKHFKLFSELYKDVVYIPGNHEYYDSSFAFVTPELSKLQQTFPNVHVLKHNQTLVLSNGQRFVGDTLWYPRTLDWRIKRGITDHLLIRDLDPTVYEENDRFIKNVIPSITPDSIVVSHHMPFEQSVSQRFKGDIYNHFFLCDLEQYNPGPAKLWIHGHTHDPCYYVRHDGTRVICNPKGYPFEGANPDFWNQILVSV